MPPDSEMKNTDHSDQHDCHLSKDAISGANRMPVISPVYEDDFDDEIGNEEIIRELFMKKKRIKDMVKVQSQEEILTE